MEDREQVPLQDSLEINQQVAAADEIQFAERRILEYIMLGKYDHLPDIVAYEVFVPLSRKVAGEPCDADILDDVVPVDTTAGDADGVGV